MKRLLSTITALVFAVSALFAADLPVGNRKDGNAVVSVSRNRLNIRSGPGAEHDVIAQLAPDEVAWVTDVKTAASGWVQISTGGRQGYVSTDFIRSVNGNDYLAWVKNYNGPKSGEKKAAGRWKDFLCIFTSAFGALLNVSWWIILLACAAIIAAEILLMLFLKRRYCHHKPSGRLYWLITAAFLLNLCVLAMYPASETEGRYSSAVWLMLAMGVFPLLINACWRLEQNGKVENKYYRNDTNCGYAGKYLGIAAWLIMGYAIFSSMRNVIYDALRGTIPIPDSFWPLVISITVISAINLALVFCWERILPVLFHTVSNVIAYLITFFFFYLVILAELDVLNTFNGFYYFIAFCCMIVNLIIAVGVPCLWIRRYRCSNCHNFSGSHVGTTDDGYSVSSHDQWHGIDNSSIKSYRTVRNVQELRRTYTTTHHTTSHIRCSYCGKNWDVSNSSDVHTETHAIKRKWEES